MAYEMSSTYDLANNKLSETNRRGFTTRYAYDDLDRLTTVTDPPLSPSMESFSQTFAYDALGNQLAATDRRGILTRFTYDLENRLLTTTRASLTVETNQYDANGNRIFVADANGHKTGFEYDERNLLKAENRPLAAITRFVLDDMGDRIQRRDPENRVTEWTYDLRRRQLSEARKMLPLDDDDDETEVSCYDGNGNRVARYLPAAVAALALSGSVELCASLPAGGWRYGYDGANRLVAVADPLEHATLYGYDGSGNRTSQTDANGHATRFEYDALERLTRKIYPEVEGVAAAESYGYDPNGNRTSLVDPKGQALAWEYDALDRETLASYPLPTPARGDDLLAIATTYDANANPLQVVETRAGPPGEETRTTTFTYDAFDRILTKTDPWDKKLTYGYDPAGNRVRLTDPDGKTTLYGYDALNRLTAATLPDGAGVTNYEYLRNSLLRRISYPNSATATHSYDLANRIQKIENRQFTAISSSYEYTYDENGNRIQQVEQNGGVPETTTYEYDDADRLTLVVYPDKTVDYTLDGVGNRTNEVTTDAATATVTSSKLFVYNERDWLTSVSDSTNPANDTTYAYDVNGNQIAKTQGGITTAYIYDTRDQLVEVQNDGTLVESYDFSYDGLRTRKSGGGGLFRYVYDARSLLLETDLGGNTISKYEWGSDRLLSLNHVTEGRVHYLFDGLGSPVSLSKPDGTLQARYLWDAWGNLRSEVGASPSIFGFTGYQRDETTGLYYAGARFYQPELGRFLNEDPFGGATMTPPSLHRYLYVYGNPTVFVDRNGREAEEVQEEERGLWDTVRSWLDPHLARTVESLADAGGAWSEIGEPLDTATKRSHMLDEEAVAANTSRLGQGRVERLREANDRVGIAVEKTADAVVETVDTVDKIAVVAGGAHFLAKRWKWLRSLVSGESDEFAEAVVKSAARLDGATPDVSATSGETAATRLGKQAHAEAAELRRGELRHEFSSVNEPIRDADGSPVLVPHRVDLRTGQPQPGTSMQAAVPDAVSLKHQLIIDDKPLGRPIAKDRQEIIRNIRAYEKAHGALPKQIAISRYDPVTGKFVKTDRYTPEDFLPKN